MWTDEEIMCHYKGAKDPFEMIKIIAQLNDVPEERIREVLRWHGEELPEKKKTVYRDTQMRVRLVSEDGRELTVPQAARINGHLNSTVYGAIRGKEIYAVGGVPYRVVRYSRRG